MTRIGVTANLGKPLAAEALRRLADAARRWNAMLVTCDETGPQLPSAERVAPEEFADHLDLLMALGGDGTMLHAARLLCGRDVPLLGVNLGGLGFLTSVTFDRMEEAVRLFLEGRCRISLRRTLEAELYHAGRRAGTYRALNDVVVGWGSTSRIVTLSLTIDDVPVGSFVCDGLIVSTPTGSTGHSLSAGGPIVHPEAAVFVINPICPHSLSNRPMVVADTHTLTIESVRSSKEQIFVVDGQDHHAFRQGDRVVIRRGSATLRFVQLPEYNYFEVLREKLGWRSSNLENGGGAPRPGG